MGFGEVRRSSDGSDRVHAVTSDSNEVAETTGGRGVSRSPLHSMPSFSFNTRRRSWMERSRAASRDMLAMVSKTRSVTRGGSRPMGGGPASDAQDGGVFASYAMLSSLGFEAREHHCKSVHCAPLSRVRHRRPYFLTFTSDTCPPTESVVSVTMCKLFITKYVCVSRTIPNSEPKWDNISIPGRSWIASTKSWSNHMHKR